MKVKYSIIIILSWLIIKYLSYYYFIYFVTVFFSWIFLSIIMFILFIFQLRNIFDKNIKLVNRILNFFIYLTLFILTSIPCIVNDSIEKMDWKYYYNERKELIEKIENNQILNNQSGIYKLPLETQLISNSGEISISRNNFDSTITVTFWIFRNFFSSPSSRFVYTTDKKEKELLNKLVQANPNRNRIIEENWYRVTYE